MEMFVTDPVWGMSMGLHEVKTHEVGDCVGEHCTIHRPSDHPLKDAPMTFRLDKGGIIERQCTHGIGHPDPDSIAWYASVKGHEEAHAMEVHGCDGCCWREE